MSSKHIGLWRRRNILGSKCSQQQWKWKWIWRHQSLKQKNNLGAACSNLDNTQQCQGSPATPVPLGLLLSLAAISLLWELSFHLPMLKLSLSSGRPSLAPLTPSALPGGISSSWGEHGYAHTSATAQFLPRSPLSYFRLSTPSERLHLRWIISRANLTVLHPQTTLSLTSY